MVGVVFARAADDDTRGFAMTTNELRPVLAAVSADSPPVASGDCAR